MERESTTKVFCKLFTAIMWQQELHSSHGILEARVRRGALLLTVAYLVALTARLVEYSLEGWFVPQLKTSIAYLGLVLMLTGEIIRELDIVTAQSNFTHDIKIYYQDGHKLVTHGFRAFS